MKSLIVPRELFVEAMDQEKIEYLNQLFQQELYQEFMEEAERLEETPD